MTILRIVAIILIIAGILVLIYGGFSYMKETKKASIGSIELTVNDKETVDIPIWYGVGGIIIGSGLLFVSSRRKKH